MVQKEYDRTHPGEILSNIERDANFRDRAINEIKSFLEEFGFIITEEGAQEILKRFLSSGIVNVRLFNVSRLFTNLCLQNHVSEQRHSRIYNSFRTQIRKEILEEINPQMDKTEKKFFYCGEQRYLFPVSKSDFDKEIIARDDWSICNIEIKQDYDDYNKRLQKLLEGSQSDIVLVGKNLNWLVYDHGTVDRGMVRRYYETLFQHASSALILLHEATPSQFPHELAPENGLGDLFYDKPYTDCPFDLFYFRKILFDVLFLECTPSHKEHAERLCEIANTVAQRMGFEGVNKYIVHQRYTLPVTIYTKKPKLVSVEKEHFLFKSLFKGWF